MSKQPYRGPMPDQSALRPEPPAPAAPSPRRPQMMANDGRSRAPLVPTFPGQAPPVIVHPAVLIAVGLVALAALGLIIMPRPAPMTLPVPASVPPDAPGGHRTHEAVGGRGDEPLAPAVVPAQTFQGDGGAIEPIDCAAPRNEAERQACVAQLVPPPPPIPAPAPMLAAPAVAAPSDLVPLIEAPPEEEARKGHREAPPSTRRQP